jgi:tetratricopeptide (TPR) repeat protein
MYIQIGEYDKAHEYCKRALELQPDNHESIVNFTDILRQLGKKD